jgi:hypothetical protein
MRWVLVFVAAFVLVNPSLAQAEAWLLDSGNIVDFDNNHILRIASDGYPNWSRYNITDRAGIASQIQQLDRSGRARQYSDYRAAQNAWKQAGGWPGPEPIGRRRGQR